MSALLLTFLLSQVQASLGHSFFSSNIPINLGFVSPPHQDLKNVKLRAAPSTPKADGTPTAGTPQGPGGSYLNLAAVLEMRGKLRRVSPRRSHQACNDGFAS